MLAQVQRPSVTVKSCLTLQRFPKQPMVLEVYAASDGSAQPAINSSNNSSSGAPLWMIWRGG